MPNFNTAAAFVTQEQFFAAHQQLLDRIDSQHAQVRDSIERSANVLTARFEEVIEDIHKVDVRTTRIEVSRDIEERRAVRSTTLVSAFVSSLVIGAKMVFDFLRMR